MATLLYNIRQAAPDIFCLIELPAGSNATEGDFVGAKSAASVISLLNDINTALGTTVWRAVPPVVTGEGGRAEGIAVFYNSTKLTFTGPWNCYGTKGGAKPSPGTSTDPTGKNPYPKPWQGVTQNNKGGQWRFNKVPKKPAKVGVAQEYAMKGERRPWFTSFQENNAPNRNIEIFSFHASFGPSGSLAAPAVEALAVTEQIMGKLPGNTVRVIGGDFNLDSNTPSKKNSYNGIVAQFTGAFMTEPTIPAGAAQYFNTSISGIGIAIVSTGNYPNYDFAKSAYDHAFVRSTAAGIPVTGQMILEQIIGVDSDYSGPPTTPPKPAASAGYGFLNTLPTSKLLPGSAPKPGKIIVKSLMANSLADILKPKPVKKGAKKTAKSITPDSLFQQFENFGRIRKTSDHMAIVIDV